MSVAIILCVVLFPLLCFLSVEGQNPSIPTSSSTLSPSVSPTNAPTTTSIPFSNPTSLPTNPTDKPTTSPTISPTVLPTSIPTTSPTARPTTPTATPSSKPTIPTATPTTIPTRNPTASPTCAPTTIPSASPTTSPTSNPTNTNQKLPHIVFILADDMGHHSVSFNAGNSPTGGNQDIIAPNLKQLADTGAILAQHYTYKFCSPSRTSLLTGRWPFKAAGIKNNFRNEELDGVELGFTFLPQRLKTAGYSTHYVGKWHQGYVDPRFLPQARGFDSEDGFFTGQQYHFSQQQPIIVPTEDPVKQPYESWRDGNVAPWLQGQSCDRRYANRTVSIIHEHASQYGNSAPLFIYLALNSPHSPIEAEQEYLDLYKNPNITGYPLYHTFLAMMSSLDDVVGDVVTALKTTGLWQNTILIFVGDNGSPAGPQTGGMCGSNWPFRGAKNSNWEGGTRTPAFVNGGLLPNTQRGKVLNDMIHIVDWYATFLVLAGLDPTDPSSTSPSPIDSINVWPFVNGTVSVSPRQVIVYDNNKLPVGSYPNAQFNVNLPGAAAIGAQGGIRSGKYKLLIGPQVYSAWYGGPLNNYFTPNSTVYASVYHQDASLRLPSYAVLPPGIDPQGPIIACSYAAPCLFDLSNDPFEHDDIAAANPVIVSQLLALFATYTAQWHVPNSVPSNIAALNEKLASNTLHFGKAYLSPWAYLSTLPNVTYLQRQAALSAPAPAPVPAPVLAPVAAPITPTSQPSEQCSSSSYNRGLAVGLGVGLGLGLPLLIIIAVAYIKFTSASSSYSAAPRTEVSANTL